MSNPELQILTASEPLTLEQEYEMQETWRHDEDSKIYCCCLCSAECNHNFNRCDCLFVYFSLLKFIRMYVLSIGSGAIRKNTQRNWFV